MIKSELVASIAKDTGLSQAKVELVVNSLMTQVKNSLAKGESLTLIGFGTFSTRERKARVGRNPKTGEKLNIKAAKVPVFKPSPSFKEIVNT